MTKNICLNSESFSRGPTSVAERLSVTGLVSDLKSWSKLLANATLAVALASGENFSLDAPSYRTATGR